jgi:hypothetical protein
LRIQIAADDSWQGKSAGKRALQVAFLNLLRNFFDFSLYIQCTQGVNKHPIEAFLDSKGS